MPDETNRFYALFTFISHQVYNLSFLVKHYNGQIKIQLFYIKTGTQNIMETLRRDHYHISTI